MWVAAIKKNTERRTRTLARFTPFYVYISMKSLDLHKEIGRVQSINSTTSPRIFLLMSSASGHFYWKCKHAMKKEPLLHTRTIWVCQVTASLVISLQLCCKSKILPCLPCNGSTWLKIVMRKNKHPLRCYKWYLWGWEAKQLPDNLLTTFYLSWLNLHETTFLSAADIRT